MRISVITNGLTFKWDRTSGNRGINGVSRDLVESYLNEESATAEVPFVDILLSMEQDLRPDDPNEDQYREIIEQLTGDYLPF